MNSTNQPLFETKAVSKATDQLMSATTEQTITSLEVAELTGKQHKNVLADIRNILSQLDENAQLNFQLGSYKDTQNQERPMFNITKEGCLCLVSGYDANLRMKIINRWKELELQAQPLLPKTFGEALILAGQQQLQIEAQQKTIAEQHSTITVMTPKADYFDGLVERKLLLNFRDTAKEFGMGQNELIKWLVTNHFLFRDQNKKLKPYNEHVVDGLFEVKEWKNGKVAGNQTLITVKGRETFRLLLNK